MANKRYEQVGSGCQTFYEVMKRVLDGGISRIARRAEKIVEQRAADVRKRWEESDYDVDNIIHQLRGEALIWLFSMVKRLRRPGVPLRTYYLSFACAAVGIFGASRIHAGGLLILLAAVLVGVRAGGLRAGLCTTFLCSLAALLGTRTAWHTPAASEILVALTTFVFVSVLMCVLVDSLNTARQEAIEQRESAEAVSRRYRFLAEASALLETEYSYEAILASVVRAIVPSFAHWATAEMFLDGQLRRVALSHRDDGLAALLRAAQRDRVLSIPLDHPLYETLLSRQARVFANVSDDTLAPLALDHQDVPGPKPVHLLYVPLIARNRLLGALTLISTAADRPFLPADLTAARDLALRVGMAIDNLSLYRGALDEADEHARREREASGQKNLLEQERMELVAQNARLALQATTDGLTGLLNHMTFKRLLHQELRNAEVANEPLSLAFLDVDRFKLYNDTYGHPAGDVVLKHVADIMKETARASDLVARYGGEEFVVVMPNTDAQGAMEAMERLRQALETSNWPNRPVTASIGVATFRPGALAQQELIAAADDALYSSKQTGRNRVTHADTMATAVVFANGAVSKAGFGV